MPNLVYDKFVMRSFTPLALFLLLSAPVQAADSIELAQYRADVDDVAWRVGNDLIGNSDSRSGFGDGVNTPWGSQGEQAAGTFQHHMQVGRYRLSGLFDVYHRQGVTEDQSYNTKNTVSVGSGFSVSPNSITHLFHSLSDEQNTNDEYPARWGGDSQAQRTGLTQTWFFARRKAHITLSYEFEQSETQALYEDLSGHSIVFSSRFPLFWGLSARISADYANNSYQEYLGVDDVGSEKQLFQAAIDHSLSRRLYGEFGFSYLNEDFDDSELSYRRYVWGLNLRYRY